MPTRPDRSPYTETRRVGSLDIETRVNPIREGNRVRKIWKLEGGAMRVEQYNGNTYVIPGEEIEMQVFIVYSMLAGL